MKIKHEDLIGSFEQQKKLVSQFTLFHDIFFSAVMKDKDAAEYVLRVCTGIEDLTIKKSNIQQSLRNMFGKSTTLDFVAEDSKGKIYNIEVQNTGDEEYFGAKRSRYYQALIDSSFFKKGKTYDEMPELYIIFITPFNPLKQYDRHKVTYEKKSFLDGVVWENGVHEIYLNAEETDNTLLSDMLQYFLSANPDDKRFGALSKVVSEQKGRDKEVGTMCKEVEDYANERAEEREILSKVKIAKNLLKKNFSLAEALETSELDEETYNNYLDKVTE